MRSLGFAGLVFAVACGGESSRIPDEDAGAEEDGGGGPGSAPGAPTILEPEADDVIQDPAGKTIVASGYDDPDGDAHAATEFEIWDVTDGARTERVWTGRVEGDDDPAVLTLADGTFEGTRAGSGRLGWDDPWSVRARNVDATGDESEWSDEVPFRTDLESWDVYDTEVVPDYYLTIPPAGWDVLAAESLFTAHVYVEGTFRFEDEEYCVGIRLKGSYGSFRTLDGKSGFKVKFNFDACGDPEQRFHGLRSLTLNNMVQDATNLHQTLGYEYFRAAGIPAPRASTVNVHVNDALWGLYANVETTNVDFIEQWFEDDDGDLYEGACGDFWDGAESCFDLETNEDAPEGRDDLAEMIDVLNYEPDATWYETIQSYVDYDRFLTFSAIESILNHWDGYTYAPNNFRLYHDPSTDLFTFIPSGIDQTYTSGGFDVDFWGEGLWGPRPLMGGRCIDDPICSQDFADRIEEMIQLFESLDQKSRAQRLFDVSSESVFADPRKEYDRNWFLWSYTDMLRWMDERPAAARAQLP